MILTILFGIVGMGLMVFIHELGHFVAAKMNGVEVEVFSLGWGTKMIGFTRGGTSYQISWLPIGGYCKMKGDEMMRQALAEGLAEMPKEKGSFYAAPPWRRIVICAFGPLFNLVFAVLAFTLIWWAGFNIYSPGNRIVLATDYTLDSFASPPPATLAGLKTGDRVTEIDGKQVESFQDIIESVSLSAGKSLPFTVERGSKVLRISVDSVLDKNTGAGRIGIYSWVDPVIGAVTPGKPADLAGLKTGDRIVRAGGKEIRHSMEFYQELSAKPMKLQIAFIRDGAERVTELLPFYDEKGTPSAGIEFRIPVFRSPRLDLPGAFRRSLKETATTVSLTIRGFGLLFQGINLRNAVAGPLRITYFIGSAATNGFALGIGQGITSFFRFLSFLSVVLFLMNLLPIPAMDGGQIVLFLLEKARGRSVTPRTIWKIQFIGFSVLIALSLFITFGDILFFLGR